MKTYRHNVTVHWGDTDPARIVFYPNYFEWFDQSACGLFESVNLDWNTLNARYGVPGLPIVEANARFKKPSVFRDQIVIESSVSEWRDKTLKVSHLVYNGDALAVEGYEVRVWSRPVPDDPKRLKAFPIPDEIKRAFE